jgi:hypothetical protein
MRGDKLRPHIRNESSIKKLRHSFPTYSEPQLGFIIDPDIGAQGATDGALDGTHGVIHTAVPVFYTSQTFDPKLMEPATNGTK